MAGSYHASRNRSAAGLYRSRNTLFSSPGQAKRSQSRIRFLVAVIICSRLSCLQPLWQASCVGVGKIKGYSDSSSTSGNLASTLAEIRSLEAGACSSTVDP